MSSAAMISAVPAAVTLMLVSAVSTAVRAVFVSAAVVLSVPVSAVPAARRIGIVGEAPGEICIDSGIRIAADSTEKFYLHPAERLTSTASETAAYEDVDIV